MRYANTIYESSKFQVHSDRNDVNVKSVEAKLKILNTRCMTYSLPYTRSTSCRPVFKVQRAALQNLETGRLCAGNLRLQYNNPKDSFLTWHNGTLTYMMVITTRMNTLVGKERVRYFASACSRYSASSIAVTHAWYTLLMYSLREPDSFISLVTFDVNKETHIRQTRAGVTVSLSTYLKLDCHHSY